MKTIAKAYVTFLTSWCHSDEALQCWCGLTVS